jgi:hypothetical protein
MKTDVFWDVMLCWLLNNFVIFSELFTASTSWHTKTFQRTWIFNTWDSCIFFSPLYSLQDVKITDSPLLLLYQPGHPSELTAQFYVHENLEDTPYEVVNKTDVWAQFVHVRPAGWCNQWGCAATEEEGRWYLFTAIERRSGCCVCRARKL